MVLKSFLNSRSYPLRTESCPTYDSRQISFKSPFQYSTLLNLYIGLKTEVNPIVK